MTGLEGHKWIAFRKNRIHASFFDVVRVFQQDFLNFSDSSTVKVTQAVSDPVQCDCVQ